MKPKTLKMYTYEIHSILFNVLEEVDHIFKKHDIEYFLIFGTLLGCIRGGSPIPWDDDIDICVPEKYWSKMNQVLKTELNKEKFFLLNEHTEKDYPNWRYVTRVGAVGTKRRMDDYKDERYSRGIFIDIFILVDVPDSPIEVKKWQYCMGVIDGIVNILAYKKGTYPRPYLLSWLIYWGTRHRFSVYDWNRLRHRIQTQYHGRNTLHVMVPFGPFGVYSLKKASYRRSWFAHSEKRAFVVMNKKKEPMKKGYFPVPVGYEEILKKTYGDWHKKPKNKVLEQLSFWETTEHEI